MPTRFDAPVSWRSSLNCSAAILTDRLQNERKVDKLTETILTIIQLLSVMVALVGMLMALLHRWQFGREFGNFDPKAIGGLLFLGGVAIAVITAFKLGPSSPLQIK